MNLHIGKRNSTDDINERRKRRRTISNDLNRGINVLERAKDAVQSSSESDSSSITSELDDSESTQSKNGNANGGSSQHCKRCKKCKCAEVSTVLKNQNEILTLLTEIRKKNADLQKSMTLEMQICRQEVIEEVQQLKATFSRMVDMTRGTDYNHEDLAFLEIAERNGANDDDGDSESEVESDDEEVEERHYLFR